MFSPRARPLFLHYNLYVLLLYVYPRAGPLCSPHNLCFKPYFYHLAWPLFLCHDLYIFSLFLPPRPGSYVYLIIYMSYSMFTPWPGPYFYLIIYICLPYVYLPPARNLCSRHTLHVFTIFVTPRRAPMFTSECLSSFFTLWPGPCFYLMIYIYIHIYVCVCVCLFETIFLPPGRALIFIS